MRRVFNELIGDDETQSPDEQLEEYWRELWQDALQEDDTSPALAHLADSDRRSVLALIADFRKELDRRTIGPRGRQVLDQLMPHLLSEICSRADAPVPLARITPLLTGIVTRTTYLELLSEFPGALKHLISLCAASPMVASQLARHPLLLDELLDPNTLYQPTATDAYRDELRQYLLRVPEDDEEQQLEALRQFKQAQLLHIAAADIRNSAGDESERSLTWLAEAMIDAVVQQAWLQMVARYGQPTHLHDRQGAVLRWLATVSWGLGAGLQFRSRSGVPPRLSDGGDDRRARNRRSSVLSAAGAAHHASFQHSHLVGHSVRSGRSLTSFWCGGHAGDHRRCLC